MNVESQREQVANIIADIRSIGWAPDQVKAGTFHINDVSAAAQFDRAAPGEQTYADLARELGIEP
jgi:hypothetical protein